MKIQDRRGLLTALAVVVAAMIGFVVVANFPMAPRVEVTFVGFTNQAPVGVASGMPQPHALFKMENKSDRLVGVVATQLEMRTKTGWRDVGTPVVRPGFGLVAFSTFPTIFGWPEPGAAEAWRLRFTLQSLCGIGHSALRSKSVVLLRNQGVTGLADQLYYPTWSLRTPEVTLSAFTHIISP